jgi:hypothetical protein
MTTTTTTGGRFNNAGDAAAAILAGNATITLVSGKTGARYTYKIRKAERGTSWFVNLLTGPSNEADFAYIGLIGATGEFRLTKASKLPADSAPVRGFGWTLARLAKNEIPEQLEVWHEGRCCRCGRKLTVPESIATGLGPECAKAAGAL